MPTKKKINLMDPNAYDLYPSQSRSTSTDDEDDVVLPDTGDIQGLYKRLAQLYPGTKISSLTRTPEHNAEVGGVPNSQHIRGTAGDFVVPKDLKGAFKEEVRGRGLEALDEGDHIHVELPPGKDTSTVNSDTPEGVTLPKSRHTGKYKYNTLDPNAYDLDLPPLTTRVQPAKGAPVLPAKADTPTAKASKPAAPEKGLWDTITTWKNPLQTDEQQAEAEGRHERVLGTVKHQIDSLGANEKRAEALHIINLDKEMAGAPGKVMGNPRAPLWVKAPTAKEVAQAHKDFNEAEAELAGTAAEQQRMSDQSYRTKEEQALDRQIAAADKSKTPIRSAANAYLWSPRVTLGKAIENIAPTIPALAASVAQPEVGIPLLTLQATAQEHDTAIDNHLRKMGVDPTNAVERAKWFADPKHVEAAETSRDLHMAFAAGTTMAAPGISKVVGGSVGIRGLAGRLTAKATAIDTVAQGAAGAASTLAANELAGEETPGSELVMGAITNTALALPGIKGTHEGIVKAQKLQDHQIRVRQLLEAEEAQRPTREKEQAAAKATAEAEAKQKDIDEAHTQNEKEKSATPDQQAADQQEADYRNAETERKFAGQTRLVKYPDGSMERVPIHPPKELTGEDIANERLDKELQAEAKRIKDEAEEDARVKRVEMGGQTELLRKRQEAAAAKVEADAKALKEKQEKSDANHKRTLADKIVAENPGKTPQELQPLLAKALEDSPPPTVTLEPAKKGKGKAQPKATTETKPATETKPGETKPVPVRTQREQVVALLKEKEEANKKVPKPGEAVSETPVKDEATEKDAEVRAAAAKMGIDVADVNPDLEMATKGESASKEEPTTEAEEWTPAQEKKARDEHSGIVNKLIEGLRKVGAKETIGAQDALGSGKIVLVPTPASIGLKGHPGGIYRTKNGKAYVFTGKFKPGQDVLASFMEAATHEGGHLIQDQPRKGRGRTLDTALSAKLDDDIANQIVAAYKANNKHAIEAVEQAAEAGVIGKERKITDIERSKLEIVPYLKGILARERHLGRTTGRFRRLAEDTYQESRRILRDNFGLNIPIKVGDIAHSARDVLGEVAKTENTGTSRIREAGEARRRAAERATADAEAKEKAAQTHYPLPLGGIDKISGAWIEKGKDGVWKYSDNEKPNHQADAAIAQWNGTAAEPKPTQVPSRRERLRLKAAEDKAPKAETKPDGDNTDLEMLGSKKAADFEEEKRKGNTITDAAGNEVFLMDTREASILEDGYKRLKAGDPTVELRDVYHLPTLYKNYPHLAHILMTTDHRMDAAGAWVPSKGVIKLNHAENMNEVLKTITHEAAHAVQDDEGMSPGTSTKAVMAEREYSQRSSDATTAIIAEIKDLNDDGKFLPKIAAKWGFNSFPELKMAVLKSQKEHISGLTPEAIERFEFIAANVGNKSRRRTVDAKLNQLIGRGDITEFTHPALKKVLADKARIEQDANQAYSNSLGERQAEEAARRLFTKDEEGNVVRETRKDTVESFVGATNRGSIVRPNDAGIPQHVRDRLENRAKAHAEEQKASGNVHLELQEFLKDGDIDLEMNNRGASDPETKTPAFKKWFGDGAVVDKDGNPFQVYHATRSDFHVFEPGDGAFGRGIYLSGFPDRLKQYWGAFGKMGEKGGPDGGNIMPVYTNLKNPAKLTDIFRVNPGDKESLDKYVALQQRLIKAGHDGAISWLNDKPWEIVVFDPKQVKSAHNRGTWDGDSDMVLEMASKKEKVDTPEEALSPKEVLRRIQDTAIREQTADFKQAEDIDTRFRRALAVDGKGKDYATVNEDVMAALTLVDEAGSKGRTEAMERFAAKYPKMAPIVAEMRATIDKATNNYIASELSTGRVLSPKGRKTIKTLLGNEGRYLTRAFSAFQRRSGRKWAENRWADYKGKLKQYLDDPGNLNEKQRDNVEALILGIDHLREKLVIPGDADLQELTTARLEQMYEDMNVGQVSRLDYDPNATDELAARRDALIEGLNNKREATTPEEWDNMAEQAMKELLGLDKSSTSVTRKISELIRDPGTLKERENVHPAIRKALGEITNAPGRVIATLETQAALNARAHTINSILKDHLGTFVIPGSQINKGNNRKQFPIALKGEQYGSLNGYYATQHVADALVSNEQAYHTYGEAWRKVTKQPGILAGKLWDDVPRYSFAPLTRTEKIGSVVARLASWPGNLGGSMLNMLKSGNFSLGTVASGVRDAGAFIKGTHDNTTTERLQDLLRYANIENVSVAEMQNVLGDKIKQYLDGEITSENVQDFIRNKEGATSKGRRNWRAFLSTYAMLDAWTKIANYHDRLNTLTEYYKLTGSDKSIEQIKREAGHTTSYTNLSNERVPEILRAFEKRGFTKFIPYFSEVARTTWTNYHQAFLDLKRAANTKNPKAAAVMRKAALKRFLGNTMATAALPSMAAVTVNAAMSAFGLAGQGFALAFNEEDAKKKRYLLSEFNRYQDLLPFGTDIDGNQVLMPVSQRVDPNGPVTDITRIFASTESPEDTYNAMVTYLSTLLIKPLWSTHLINSMTMNTVPKSKISANYPAFTEAVNDFFANIGVGPSPVNKALYSVESLVPNVAIGQDPKYDMKFGEDADPAVVNTVAALEKMGMSFEKADLTKPLGVYGNDAAEAKTRNRAVLADDLLLNPVDDEQWNDAVTRYALAERERFEEGQKSVEALRAWKVDEQDIPQMLVDAGWSKEEARNMVLGNNEVLLSLASLKQSKIGTRNSENTAEAVKKINESRVELEEMGIKVKRQ